MGSDAPLVDISPDKIVKFETAVRPVPQADAAEPKMISQGPSVCIFNKEDPQEVLASWLFTQFLLTDQVQIDYSSTEGYLPVTQSALNNEAYKEYLAASGSDQKAHYSVKLDAVKLIMDHTEDTFVTPVFNGSASLRDAASYLVEDTVKYPVQFNGKMRFTIDLPATATQSDVLEAVKASPDAAKWMTAEPKKVIFVPKKIINIVL
jgi:multiple sugar transport system substrate-binding protein